MRNHVRLCRKITASGLAAVLLVVGLTPPAAAQSCQGWNTEKFFETATVDEVRACLSAGEDPNEHDTKGLTALHRAARDTADPAVIEALLDAAADPRTYSIAGRLPWDFARKNNKIKGSDANQRLRIESAKKADWSRVQAVAHDTKTKVLLYQDIAPRGVWKIKGRFESATDESITLMLKDGQTHTLSKAVVRKVLVPRPFAKRWPGWITAAVTTAIWVPFMGVYSDFHAKGILLLGGLVSFGPTAIAFGASGMHSIYDVPPKHRILRPQGVQHYGDQDNSSGNPEKPSSPNR